MEAYCSSLNALSSKPMEKVFTGSGDCNAMEATTELESIPPLRNAPSGTSAIMRILTDSSKTVRTCSHACSNVIPGVGSSAGAGRVQYLPCPIRPLVSKLIHDPGGSFRIAWNGE